MSQTRSTRSTVLRLTESAIMLALSTVLSLVTFIDLPFGGSVTPASAAPLLIIAYRYGCGWGTFVGLAYGLLQLATGSSLSYVTGFWSVVAVLLLDYLVAFCAVGLGGVFRRLKNQPAALVLGAILYGIVRYLCHVLSGATVWAGISIPTAAALNYSFAYNAAYMVPETLLTAVGAYFLGSLLDFSADKLSRLPRRQTAGTGWASAVSALLVSAALVFDVLKIIPYTQSEDGLFTFARLGEVSWLPVVLVSAIALVLAGVLLGWAHAKKAAAKKA